MSPYNLYWKVHGVLRSRLIGILNEVKTIDALPKGP